MVRRVDVHACWLLRAELLMHVEPLLRASDG